jgi:hypothetical protein
MAPQSLPIATLDGVEFRIARCGEPVTFRIPLDALSMLRDLFAPGLNGSPLQLFDRLANTIVTLAEKAPATTSSDDAVVLDVPCLRHLLDL